MKKKTKISHPRAEVEFIEAVTDATERYYALLLNRKIREEIRNKNKNCALKA